MIVLQLKVNGEKFCGAESWGLGDYGQASGFIIIPRYLDLSQSSSNDSDCVKANGAAEAVHLPPAIGISASLLLLLHVIHVI